MKRIVLGALLVAAPMAFLGATTREPQYECATLPLFNSLYRAADNRDQDASDAPLRPTLLPAGWVPLGSVDVNTWAVAVGAAAAGKPAGPYAQPGVIMCREVGGLSDWSAPIERTPPTNPNEGVPDPDLFIEP